MSLEPFLQESPLQNVTMDSITIANQSNITVFDPILSPLKCIPYRPRNGTSSMVNIVSYCYVLPTVCALGILGNIANLITLASSRLKAVSYMYLRGLGIADMLCMIFVLTFVSFEMISASSDYRYLLTSYGVVWFRAHLMLPLINWPVSAGILIVLALTLERYISIAWPILFREWNSARRAAIIIMAAYLFSLILYIPMCWQHEVIPICPPESVLYSNGRLNVSVMEFVNGWASADNNLLVKNKMYMAYKYSREGILKIIPIVALTFLNLQIIIAFKKVRKRRRRLNSNSGQSSREQRSLLFLLAGIVVLFFICNIPAAINLIFITDAMKAKTSYVIFRAVANLLEITNHALNFYNFCLCSTDYRQTFIRKFPCVKRMQESAEDIKRRVSNSVARVQGSRATSAVIRNHVEPEAKTFAATSLKSANGMPNQRPPLRRAVSSDALLKLDHCTLKDGRGRRFGHHYGQGRQSIAGRHLTVTNTGQNIAYKKCDSLQNILEPNFEAIPEDCTFSPASLRAIDEKKLGPAVETFMEVPTDYFQCQNVSTMALIDFEVGQSLGREKLTDSSLSYVTAEYKVGGNHSDYCDHYDQETASLVMVLTKRNGTRSIFGSAKDDDSDTMTYSSANDVYL